ncbi:MAG: hypothetical protein JXA13_09570 [Anaerolineales bacterium]|nr:hypothetical protein [Anaerolineales bacterium]
MKDTDRIDPCLEKLLDDLKTVPDRDPGAAVRGRSRFLAEADRTWQAVSKREIPRLSRWKPFTQKESFTMNAIITIVVLAGLVFGGAGTVYAAQDDLPNEPLYPLKTMSEDVRLGLAADPQQEFNLLTEMAQTRATEMAMLVNSGITPPENVPQRLQQQTQQMLQLAANMDPAEMDAALQQLQTQLRTQTQLMTMLQSSANSEAVQLLEQTRSSLQDRLRLVEDGLADPEGFRHTVRNEKQPGLDDSTEPGYGNGADGEAIPANGNGFGNEDRESGKPEDQNGNGQGSGNGTGNGNQQQGQGSGSGNSIVTPTPVGPGLGGDGGKGGQGGNH